MFQPHVAIFSFFYHDTRVYHILVWLVVHCRNPYVQNGCQCSILHSHETVVMESIVENRDKRFGICGWN